MDLLRLLGGWPETDDPRVVVGAGTGDDAAILRGAGDRHLVFTTDFFAPIVDDPEDYGAIAAANALSDVYAMGGEPLAALNLVAWPPDDVLPHTILRRVLDAARTTLASAGASIVGGHSITDTEPKFGLAVLGTVHPDELITNSAGQPGDVLLLTKPLGTGIVANALKHQRVTETVLEAATASMRQLNRQASAAARRAGIRCGTDVTGFGLLGHLHALGLASGCAARVTASCLPVLPGVLELVERQMIPGGTVRNLRFAANWASWPATISETLKLIAADAQTSGGLLLAASPTVADVLISTSRNESPMTPVGELIEGRPGDVQLVA